jgi:hypothetical protein
VDVDPDTAAPIATAGMFAPTMVAVAVPPFPVVRMNVKF